MDELNLSETPKDGLTSEQFYKILEELRLQPAWRKEADKAVDYYDGNQVDAELAEDLRAKGMGPLITNLIKPAINTVLGQEAQARTDWRVTADSDDQMDMSEALSAKLMEAERESRADRACSDAYASMVKTGIGWVEVSKESNPFKYPYRVAAVHRREMSWDWNAKEADLSDARYIVRQRWFDVDQASAYLPEHAELIKAAGGGWSAEYRAQATENASLMHSFDQESRVSITDWHWRDTGRSQVLLYEVWYKTHVTGVVINLPDGRVVELDQNNQIHQMAVYAGVAQPRSAVFTKTRVSLWLGPHRLEDHSYGTKNYPYKPFWGYREDLTGVPYGLIRSMISPQDEVNARRRKLLWLLSAKRVMVDSDALDGRYNDISDVIAEVARPDAVIVRNPDRRNANGVDIDDQTGLAAQQFEIMNEAKQGIQDVAGIYSAMMGQNSKASSGTAIQNLVEQGNMALAEINDNYRYSRVSVGEELMDLLLDDMADKEMSVTTDGMGARRTIKLNTPAIDPITGFTYKENDVSKARFKVALHDIASAPAYRQQQMVQMGETLKSLPPELQAPLMPFYLEATDLPKRKEMAQIMRKLLGQDTGDGAAPDPEKEQMAMQLQELQAQMNEIAQVGDAKIEELTTKLSQAEQVIKDRSGDLELKAKELDLKETESERKALLDQQRLDLDKERVAAENQRVVNEAEVRNADMAESQAARDHAERLALQQQAHEARVPAESVVNPQAQLDAVTAAIEKLVKPISDRVEAIANKPVEQPSTPQPQPAPIINVTIDGKTGAVKKRIDFEYDDKGNLKAGTATEEDDDD